MIACILLQQIGIACERVRVPTLWGQPVALVDGHGIVVATSDESQAAGVRIGMKSTAAKAVCGALVTLPYDRESYELASESIWDALAVESSLVEPITPELCYTVLDHEPWSVARSLALRIGENARIPIRVGLARSKLLARETALIAGPDELVVTPGTRSHAILARVPLERVPQITPSVHKRLVSLGVRTLGDIRALPEKELRHRFGQTGVVLKRLAEGEDSDPVQPLWPPRSIERRIAFEDEVCDAGLVEEALRRCAAAIARSLTAGEEYCRILSLEVMVSSGDLVEASEKLSTATDDRVVIGRGGLRLFKRLAVTTPVVSLRLRAGGLGAGSGIQLGLFDESGKSAFPHELRRRLDTSLTHIRTRFGVGAIVTAHKLHEAQRIHLWTYTLGRLLDEQVTVQTDKSGQPVRYQRRNTLHIVSRILDHWSEETWFWDSLIERIVFRVQTNLGALTELHQIGPTWRVQAVAD
jgi:nucleotidyltransferase/DNA polymerase involved in DNA repair